ncbi:MAG: hypothetical protein AAFO91_06640, partial [Bacteroidota bacterium]
MAPRSLNPLQTCSSFKDCPITSSTSTLAGYSECSCGFNSSGYSYCQPVQGDAEFVNYYRSLMYMTIDNYLCHTMARFGHCDAILEDIWRIFKTNELYYEHGPVYKMNDMCVAKNVNWSFYRFYVEASVRRFWVGV